MDITVKDCSYFVDVSGKKKGLLASVSASFPKGVVTVLMGHRYFAKNLMNNLLMWCSGAGKTTLMDLIAGRKTDGIMTGSIEFDGSVKTSKSNIAYVQVTDVHIGEFTVMQNLYYAARLRLGNDISEAEIKARCETIANTVSLDNVLHVCVGSELTKGISGGQKKRLSIAVELLALPAVLCLDEPTSGLLHLSFLFYLFSNNELCLGLRCAVLC
jgi:ABC-type sugar transport system ATPase subunit